MTIIKHPKDFWAGVMFVAFGIASIVIANAYPLGTAARMGPGYFPRILGILLISLGGLLTLRAFRLQGDAITRFAWKPFLIVLGSVVLFGIAYNTLGLVVAIFVLIIVSSLASHEHTWLAPLISSIVLSIASVLTFVYGLKLQFQIWPPFLGN